MTIQVISVDCDQGAREGLELRPDQRYWYGAQYLLSQEDAFANKLASGLHLVGIVPVMPTVNDSCHV